MGRKDAEKKPENAETALITADADAQVISATLGSSKQPALVKIGGKELPLSEVVAAALAISGLSLEAWNALPEDERELHIEIALEDLRRAEALQSYAGPTIAAPASEMPELAFVAKYDLRDPFQDGGKGRWFRTGAVTHSQLTPWVQSQVEAGFIKRVTE